MKEGRQGAVVFNEKSICTSSTNFKARLLEFVGFLLDYLSPAGHLPPTRVSISILCFLFDFQGFSS